MAHISTNGATRLVIVDPRIDDYRCMVELARAAEVRLTLTTTGASALRLTPSFADAIWLICTQLPDMEGLDLLEMLGSLQPRVRAVVIDNEYDRDREMHALRARAIQYVCKPMHPAWLASWRSPADPLLTAPPPHRPPSMLDRTPTHLR